MDFQGPQNWLQVLLITTFLVVHPSNHSSSDNPVCKILVSSTSMPSSSIKFGTFCPEKWENVRGNQYMGDGATSYCSRLVILVNRPIIIMFVWLIQKKAPSNLAFLSIFLPPPPKKPCIENVFLAFDHRAKIKFMTLFTLKNKRGRGFRHSP